MTARVVRPGVLSAVAGLEEGDLAWGWPFGAVDTVTTACETDGSVDGASPEPRVHPRTALEECLAAALSAGPVVVSFSGGRDSSAMLALTMHVARREGLPQPIALTARYADDPDADEDDWQEMVVRHLAVDCWLRVDASSATDALGPWSTEVLERVGHNAFPAGATSAGIRAVHARGGTLVDGEPGDWVLGPHRMTVLRHVARRRGRLTRAEWSAALGAAAPPLAGRLAGRTAAPPWLSPLGARALRRAVLDDARAEPLTWDAAILSLPRRRFFTLGMPTLTAIIRSYGAEPLQPLRSPAFLTAFARWGSWRGLRNRTAAMRLLCGDLLPQEVLQRQSKASFNRQFFGPEVREFATSWTGRGVPHELVDAEALRREWLSDTPDARSLSLLQQAWLADRSGTH